MLPQCIDVNHVNQAQRRNVNFSWEKLLLLLFITIKLVGLYLHTDRLINNAKKNIAYLGAMVKVFPLGNEKSSASLPTRIPLYIKVLLLGFFRRTCQEKNKIS